MRSKEVTYSLRHEVGSAEGMRQRRFGSCGTIMAEAIRHDERNGRFACPLVETAGLEPILAVSIVDHRPLAVFSDDNNRAQKIVTFRGSLLEKSANRKAIVEGGIICTGSAVYLARKESPAAPVCCVAVNSVIPPRRASMADWVRRASSPGEMGSESGRADGNFPSSTNCSEKRVTRTE